MVTTRRRSEDVDGRGTTERLVDSLEHVLISRWPHVTGPLGLAGACWALAWAAHRWPGIPQWALTVAVVVVVLLGVESIRHLPGPRERGYAWACWLGVGGWTVAAAWLGPAYGWPLLGWPALTVVWAGLLVVLWPPWFRHRRIRRGVVVSHEIGAWDGDAVGLKGVDLVEEGAGADGHSWWARLKPQVKGEYTLDDLRRRIPHIAARFGARKSDITIEAMIDDHEGDYLLRRQTAPREGYGAPYAPPVKRPSLRVPFEIGALGDRTRPVLCELWRKDHGGVDGLTAGMKGYGKSTYYRRMVLQAIAAHDALPIICDLKPGSPDYRDVGPAAYLYAITPAEIDLVIRVLLTLCRVRGETPRPDRKVLPVFLDETSLYYSPTPPEPVDPAITDPAEQAKAARNAKRVAERADVARAANMLQLVGVSRAFDISVHETTQRAEDKFLGGSAVRSNLLAGQVVGFHSPRAADSALLSTDKQFDLSQLPRGVPGEVLISNGQHHDVTRASLHAVTRDAARTVLDRFGADQGDLHDDELEALGREFGLAWGSLRAANRDRPADPDPGPAAEAEPPPGRMTRDESLQATWEALDEFPRPVMARDVAAAMGKSEEIARLRLNELAEQGRAVRDGKYRWIKYSAVHRGDQDGDAA